MPIRLIEIIAPKSLADEIRAVSDQTTAIGRWDDDLNENLALIRLLVKTEQTEEMLDALQNRFSNVDGFRVIMLPVEATVPRLDDSKDDQATTGKKSPERISREELYNDVAHSAKISKVFVAQVILATLVAAVGLSRDDTAIIIGAMVIAPLLGPNVSLSLATTLGDIKLARQSLQTNALGLAVALACSLLIGFLFPVDATVDSIESRTQVSGGDIILALASGCAGVLAFTSGAPSALIGVMVAVALLPPFAVFGLLIASGDFDTARGALLLVAVNVICVNLAGVVTFAMQGLRPRTWWEVERAKKATRIAVTVWTLLLVVLTGLILVSRGQFQFN